MTRRMRFKCPTCNAVAAEGDGRRCSVDGTVFVPVKTLRNYPNDPILGRRLKDRYAVFDVLGVGGFGAVYRVLDETTGLHVALKTIHNFRQDERIDLVSRFLQEANMLTRLKSSRIVDVYDADVVDGVLFMVLELIDGHTLKELIHLTGPMALDRMAHIVHQILEGLEHAHALGLIHRDLKPGNLLVDTMDAVKIIDFGVAKVINDVNEAGPHTETGLVLGTVRYMAPEQLKAGQVVGPAADLYAVGMMMYEMLVGRAPYHGSPMEIAAAHLYEASPELPHHIDHPDFRRFFARSVAKPIDERFTSATEMRLQLIESLPAHIADNVRNQSLLKDTESVGEDSAHQLMRHVGVNRSPLDTVVDVEVRGNSVHPPTAHDGPEPGNQARPPIPVTPMGYGSADILMPLADSTGPSQHRTDTSVDNPPSRTNLPDQSPLAFAPTVDGAQVPLLKNTGPHMPKSTNDMPPTLEYENEHARPTTDEASESVIPASSFNQDPNVLSNDPMASETPDIVRGSKSTWWVWPSLVLFILCGLLMWQQNEAVLNKSAVNEQSLPGVPAKPEQVATQIYGAIQTCRCAVAKKLLSRLPGSTHPDLRAELIESIQACTVDDPKCSPHDP